MTKTTDDIPKQVEEETDAVVERVFSEWDKWFEGADDPVRLELREMQNQSRELEDKINSKDVSEEDALTLKENLTVLKKKMKTRVQDILAQYRPEPKNNQKNIKSKSNSRPNKLHKK